SVSRSARLCFASVIAWARRPCPRQVALGRRTRNRLCRLWMHLFKPEIHHIAGHQCAIGMHAYDSIHRDGWLSTTSDQPMAESPDRHNRCRIYDCWLSCASVFELCPDELPTTIYGWHADLIGSRSWTRLDGLRSRCYCCTAFREHSLSRLFQPDSGRG